MIHRYETKIYDIIRMMMWSSGILVSALFLVFFISLKLKSVAVVVIGFCAVMIVPFVYQKKALALCMEKVAVVFDEQGLRIEYFSKKDDSIRKIKQFNWDEIKSFELHFTKGIHTVIGLYLTQVAH